MNKALLIGVNKYPPQYPSLRGCINDVMGIRDVLLKFYGFEESNISVLMDDRATTDGILDRLKFLVQDVKPGDKIVMSFSGHGSQVVDKINNIANNHMDEIICPSDLNFDNGNFITQDDIASIFKTIPDDIENKVTFDVIMDACHSGMGDREIFALSSLSEQNDFKPRFLQPPLDIKCRESRDLDSIKLLRDGSRQLLDPKNIQFSLFAACKRNQTAADAYINGTYNGAFSFYFCKNIKESQGKILRSDLVKRINLDLQQNGYSQIAELDAPDLETKELFTE